MSNNWYHRAIAVTGAPGSGKSTVSGIFRKLGALVIEADVLARKAVEPPSPVLAEIERGFGPGLLTPDGRLDRKALAEIVFHDPARRKELEALLHPVIRRLAAEEYARAGGDRAPLVVYDCPLLFETDLHRLGFKKKLLIDASEAIALERVQRRDGSTVEEYQARLAAQRPMSEKRKLADIVIENNSTLAELEEKVGVLFEALKERSG